MVQLVRTPYEGGTRIEVMVDGAVASSVVVVDRTIRIGHVHLKMGGIGDVSTRRAYRQHGYARKMLEDAVVFMREAGYHFSALFGIPDFYPKFGYVPGPGHRFHRNAMPSSPARNPIRPFTPQDAARMRYTSR